MKQCDLTKGFAVFFTVMITLFCGVMPSSWAEQSANCDCCDNQKFEGCYAFWHDGEMMMRDYDSNGDPCSYPNGDPIFTGPPIPIASIGVLYINKQGDVTGDEVMNFGCTSYDAELIGTYTVNPDCTGTLSICATPVDNLPPIKSIISFVIISGGKEIQTMTTKMTACDSNLVVAAPLNIVGIAKKQSCEDDQ